MGVWLDNTPVLCGLNCSLKFQDFNCIVMYSTCAMYLHSYPITLFHSMC